MLHLLALSSAAGAADVSLITTPHSTDGSSLFAAQAAARGLVAARRAALAVEPARRFADLVVQLPGGVLWPPRPLVLTGADSGVRGAFRVVWRGAAAPANGSVISGGVAVSGPWHAEGGGVFSAAAPGKGPFRQLFVGETRYERTTQDAAPMLSGGRAKVTPTGLLVTSTEPLSWPAGGRGVELVDDHTWVQHRFPVIGVIALQVPPPPPPPKRGSCHWSAKTAGHSPGSSLGEHKAASYAACMQICCALLPKCKGIIYSGITDPRCYALDRPYEHGFLPGGSGFVADLNCTKGEPAVCDGSPPPAVWRSNVSFAPAAWHRAINDPSTATGFKLATLYPMAWEAVGNWSTSPFTEQWHFAETSGKILVKTANGKPPSEPVTLNGRSSLLRMDGAHDITMDSIAFEHAGWTVPSIDGIVERYGGTLFNISKGDHKHQDDQLYSMPAAVTLDKSTDVSLARCSFARLGLWGLRIQNGSQRVSVTSCSFKDLSGGGASVGDVGDTKQADPARQTAEIAIVNNTLERLGMEYRGSVGLHSFCMRQSTWAHNSVKEVAYTGLSFNWPSPQGPTPGPLPAGPGYSRDNVIAHNDVSRFCFYMKDGGGIHTIGLSANTSIESNWWHDQASGGMCKAGGITRPCHSTGVTGIIYIDNWSVGYRADRNVVTNCPAQKLGWIFYQGTYGSLLLVP